MSVDEIDDSSAPLIEHLAELRTRILYCLGAFVACFFIGYWFYAEIYAFLTHPLCDALRSGGQTCQLVLLKPQEGFLVAMRIAAWGGFFLAFPVIAYQLWRFVAPGLYRSEKGAFLPFLLASPAMFFLGAAFAFYVVLPAAFQFFLSFQTPAMGGPPQPDGSLPAGVVFQGSMESYLSLTMSFVLAFGVCFQLPVLLTLMGRAGLISSAGLKSTRKYAVVLILIVAALVTPPDAISQLIMFSAVYPLYEISIFLVARFERQREAQMRADGTWVDVDEDETTA